MLVRLEVSNRDRALTKLAKRNPSALIFLLDLKDIVVKIEYLHGGYKTFSNVTKWIDNIVLLLPSMRGISIQSAFISFLPRKKQVLRQTLRYVS